MNNSTLIYPNTYYNEGIRTTRAKNYRLIMNLYPLSTPINFHLTTNIWYTKSLLTPTKPLSINIYTLFYPNTHQNKGQSSISFKKYHCIMNLYPPENTQKFPFDVKYEAY